MNADKFTRIVRQVRVGIFESLSEVLSVHGKELTVDQVATLRHEICMAELPIVCLPMVKCEECVWN